MQVMLHACTEIKWSKFPVCICRTLAGKERTQSIYIVLLVYFNLFLYPHPAPHFILVVKVHIETGTRGEEFFLSRRIS